MAYFEGHHKFSTRTQKHIIFACMALHNSIHDGNLHDKDFDRCDADEGYLLQQTSTTTQTQNKNPHGENIRGHLAGLRRAPTPPDSSTVL